MILFTDRLTGLPGRELLDELRDRFAGAPAHDPWTVMMIDIDQFKLINDAYGHLLGDLVLAEVGSVLRKGARAGDAVIRFGGDEFVAVFPSTAAEGAMTFAGRSTDAMASLVFPHGLKPTLSIGIAERQGGETSLDAVLARADHALYRAKHGGRNAVVRADSLEERARDEFAFTDFVGRKRELLLLKQVLDEALARGARLAVVSGDAGVGKTRLAEELSRYGAFRGCLVQRSACVEFGQVEPYSFATRPVREMLAGFLPHGLQHVQHAAGPLHPASSALLPGFAVADMDQRFFTEDSLKFRVFDDILRVLAGITMVQPVVLIVEDVQWMPRHDLELLAYLVRSAADSPLLVVVTMRVDGDRPHPAAEFLSGLTRDVPSVSLTLDNLDRDEATSLLTLALRDPGVPFEVLGILYRQTGGNPLFLRELLRALRDGGQITPGEAGRWVYRIAADPTLPASLTQVISRRLASLSEPARRLIRTASLAGRPFSVALLTDVAEKPELEVAECLEEALKSGIISEGETGPEPVYVFAHEMVRSYAYRDIPIATKTLLHARMGRFCERLLKSGRDDMLAATAHHYAESLDTEKSVEYALPAARASAERRAARETLWWLGTYLERVDETTAAREDLLYAYRTRGEFQTMTGDGEAAEQSLARALELAETDQDRVAVLARIGDNCQKLSRYADARNRYDAALALTGDAVGRADLLVSIVYLDYLQGRYAEAMARLDDVRALLDSASPSPEVRHVWAAYHKRTGDIRQELGSPEEALAHYATSLGLYRALGDRIGESAVVNNMSSCYSAMGELEKSLELLHEAARMNAQIDDALGLAIAHYNLAETYGSLNEVSLAREYYERYMQANARIGNDLGMGYGHFGLGYLAGLENDLPSAERSYRAAADVFLRLETAQLAAMARIRLAEILIEQGNLAEGAEEVTRVRASRTPADDEQEAEVCYLEGLLAIASRGEGDGGSASSAVELLTEALQRTKPANIHGIMKCAYHLARTLERSDQRDRARETLAHALRTLRRHLERLGNHRYQESLLQAREVRRVRTAYEQLTGARWDAYSAGGEA